MPDFFDAAEADFAPAPQPGNFFEAAEDPVGSYVRQNRGGDWDSVARGLTKHFGVSDPTPYQQQFRIEGFKAQQADRQEGTAEFLTREAVPFVSSLVKGAESFKLESGRSRMARGEKLTADELRELAALERNEDIKRREGAGGAAVRGLAGVPAILGELAAAGPVLRAAGLAGEGVAASALRGAASTPLTPGAYFERAAAGVGQLAPEERTARNVANEGASALALGAIQNAVLGQLQAKINVPTVAGRVAAKTAVGLAEQQGVDVGVSALDDAAQAITGKTLGLNTRYGTVGSFVRGDDDRWKRLAAQTATFALFSALHPGRGQMNQQAEFRSPSGDKTTIDAPPDIIDAFKEGLDGLAKKGYSRNRAADEIGKANDRFVEVISVEPDKAAGAVRDAVKDSPEPVKKYAETLAKVAESAYEPPSPTPEPEGVKVLPPEKPANWYDHLPDDFQRELAGFQRGGKTPKTAAKAREVLASLDDQSVRSMLTLAETQGLETPPQVKERYAVAPSRPAESSPANRSAEPAEQLPNDRTQSETPTYTPRRADGPVVAQDAPQIEARAEPTPAPKLTPIERQRAAQARREPVAPAPLNPVERKPEPEPATEPSVPDRFTPEQYDTAGLTPRERYVLDMRLEGKSLEIIGSDPAIARPGRGPMSREGVRKIEQAALAKLGHGKSVAEDVYAAERAERAADLIERGRGIRMAELRADPRDVPKVLKRREDALTKLADMGEELNDRFFKELERAERSGQTAESVVARFAAELAARGAEGNAPETRKGADGPDQARTPDAAEPAPEVPSAEGVATELLARQMEQRGFPSASTARAFEPGSAPSSEPTLREKVADAFAVASAEYRKLGGEIAPRTTDAAPEAGNRIARFISSATHARELTPFLVERVMGPLTRYSDRVRLGAVLTERRLRHMREFFVAESQRQAAEGNKEAADGYMDAAREVKSVVGQVPEGADPFGQEASPFFSEQEYQQALADPEIQAAIRRWGEHVVPVMEENYRNATGLDADDPIASPTQVPGSPVNLKYWKSGDDRGPSVVRLPGQGNLKNTRAGKLPFADAARGNAEGYDLDVANIIENSVYQGLRAGNKGKMYRALIESGLAERGKPGRNVEIGGEKARELPNAFPAFGEREGTSLYLSPDVYPEVRQALRVDESYKLPVVTPMLRAITSLNVALSLPEVTSHTKNLLSLAVRPGVHPFEIAKNIAGVVRKDPETRARIVELAQTGALKPAGFEGGKWLPERYERYDPTFWTGKFLDVVDRAVRLSLDDAYTRLVRQGRKRDTEEGRRNFINQAGQYNAAAQQKLVAMLRETGIGPFATAGTNFWVQGLRTLTGASPGDATSGRAELGLRAEAIGRVAAVAAAAATANYLINGNLLGDDRTPLGAVKVGEKGGKTRYFDLVGLTGLTRGARETGLLAAGEGLRGGEPGSKVADEVAHGIAHSALHPAVGPGPGFLYTAATGKNTLGNRVAERAKGKESQAWLDLQAAVWGLNPTVSTLLGKDRSPEKKTDPLIRVGKALGPFGVKERERKVR